MITKYEVLAQSLLIYKYDDEANTMATISTAFNLKANSIALQKTLVANKEYTPAGFSMYLDVAARTISTVIWEMEKRGISSKDLILTGLIKLIEEEIKKGHSTRHVIEKRNDGPSKN